MKLTLNRIIEAGMTVFANVGYERLSMRLVAENLDVQVGSLYYHVRNKAALLSLMADSLAHEAVEAGTAALAQLTPSADYREQAMTQLVALRLTLRNHLGAARLLSASPRTLGDGALGLMERLLRTLTGSGLPIDQAVILADVLLSYVTGFVLQEEAGAVKEPLMPITTENLLSRFPLTAAAAGIYDDDEMFRRALLLLCDRTIQTDSA